MEKASSCPSIVRFGVFEADLGTGELRKQGIKVRLQEQPFQILQMLLERPGQVVSREDLRQRIWPADTFVDFDHGLYSAIKKLREALGDSAENPRFVETLAKRGYRFIAPVAVNGTVGASVAQEAAKTSGEPSPPCTFDEGPTRASPSLGLPLSGAKGSEQALRADDTIAASSKALTRNAVLAVFAAAVLLLGVVLGLYSSRFRQWFQSGTGSPPIRSLAVLPLENLSGDPAQEYFSDGMTDALITDLAQISSIRVISRTSSMQYKQTRKSLPQIAGELKVDGIVEGTVQRSGDQVRITAQLIHGSTDKHLWASSYERETRDVFVLERDLAGEIASQVQARLATAKRSQLAQPRAVNPKALEAYLQGNFYVTRGEQSFSDEVKRKAAGYFQQAIDADPTFAPAYIGLAESHSFLLRASREDWAIVRKALERALALDPSSSVALEGLADIEWRNFDWARAERDHRRAIALNPNNAWAHDDLCYDFVTTGRLDEGLRECEIAQTLDPNTDHLANILIMRGDYDRAIALLRRVAEIGPGVTIQPTYGMNGGLIHYELYWAYLADDKKNEAVQQLERACALWGWSQLAANMHRAFADSGYRGSLRAWGQYLEDLHATNQGFLPEALAAAYAALGDNDRAFYWLDQAYTHRENVSLDWGLTILKVDPLLDPLHSDLRYEALLRRIGLPP